MVALHGLMDVTLAMTDDRRGLRDEAAGTTDKSEQGRQEEGVEGERGIAVSGHLD